MYFAVIELKNNDEDEREKYLNTLQEVRREAEDTIMPILRSVIAEFREIMGVN